MSLYKELAEYTGRPWELVKLRCEGAAAELAWLWPQYDGVLAFYRETDLYIFDLTFYQTMLGKNNAHNWLRHMIKKHGWKTMLDFGGGTGEWSIIAAKAGCKVTYVDVEGSKTMEYARWRFKQHGVDVDCLGEDAWPLDPFDAIIAMDVFEHLEAPVPLIEQFAGQSKFLFANPNEVKYNDLYPQHISHYKLEPLWEHVEGYLWKIRAEPGRS